MNKFIENEKIESFKYSFERDIVPFIIDLKKYARVNDVPIILDDTKDFIEIILNLTKPKSILEIGTAIGYSTLIMANNSFVENIITIENYKTRIEQAKLNFDKYDVQKKITLIDKDASVALKELCDKEYKFDFVFLDCAKSQYINWLPYVKLLLKKNAIFITDNVLNNFETLKSRFLLEKRKRSMHDSLKEYIRALKNDKDFFCKILNIGDGITFVKKMSN